MRLAILSTLLFASAASAATIPLTSITAPAATEDTHAIFFPGSAHSNQPKTQITNAELLRRGQPLAKPVKLYDAIALAKRIDPAPPQASSMPPSGTAQKNYKFAACANQVNFKQPQPGVYTVGTANLQQAANDCATRSQVDGPSNTNIETFSIFPNGDDNCLTRVDSYVPAPCDSTNYGVYEIIP